jgi:hypothetical protein
MGTIRLVGPYFGKTRLTVAVPVGKPPAAGTATLRCGLPDDAG